jgi:predicted Zn-dependent protease
MAGRTPPNWVAVAALLVAGVVVFDVVRRASAGGGERARDADTTPSLAADTAARPRAQAAQGGAAAAPTAPAVPPPPAAGEPGYMDQLARAETRRRIRASAGIAYLDAILATSEDSMLHRWDNRLATPVRVAFAPTRAANFQPTFLEAIRQAFARWEGAGVPVRFDLSADTATAEVRVVWRIQFEIERTGQTDLTWDQDGRIESAVMTFATFDTQGRPMGIDDIRVVALHEIGHLIGLDHSPDSTDVMFPATRVRDLSERDIRTALLLYQLIPGSIR